MIMQSYKSSSKKPKKPKNTHKAPQNKNLFNMLKYQNKCLEYLPIIRNIHIPTIKLNQLNEAFFIDFRWFTHIEFLVRNAILKLPTWSHTIVCGNNNIVQIRNMCDTISPDIRIIHLDINNISISEYSNLLMTTVFWDRFYGEKLLLYQSDSYIFHGNIEPFLEYDYVGSPWPKSFSYYVGNGGFSLRTKKTMIECIEKARELVSTIEEDIFFVKYITLFNIGKIPLVEKAKSFGVEFCEGNNPVGGHKIFRPDSNLTPAYKSLQIIPIKSTNKIWNKYINYGIVQKIMTYKNTKDTIFLIDNINIYFKHYVYHKEWIGIIHEDIMDLSLHNLKFSLFHCNLLICFKNRSVISEDLEDYVQIVYTDYPTNLTELQHLYSGILKFINNIY
jgi:hypothetical protein